MGIFFNINLSICPKNSKNMGVFKTELWFWVSSADRTKRQYRHVLPLNISAKFVHFQVGILRKVLCDLSPIASGR